MKDYQLFSDSSCDLPENLIHEHQIQLIPFYVSFDRDKYYKENIDMSNEVFYDTLTSKNQFATTSLPSVQDYINIFRPTLKDGYDIICLCLSQKFSGSYQSAINAKQILDEQYTNCTIQIIDSIQATAGQGLLLLQMAKMKKSGLQINEVVERVNRIKSTSRIMFTLDTLEYLTRGRRIGKVVSLAKEMMGLKPLIQLKDAELIPYSNIRGRKKSLNKVYEMMVEYFIESNENPSSYDFCIVNATTANEANALQKRVEQYLGRDILYPVFQIGVTIGTYTGPGAIGICFIKKYEKEG
ncbi:MAG TPA: DegV family protein [Mobilitalea sp.]|nr:DegV family protein [Mobilitalea sp.]